MATLFKTQTPRSDVLKQYIAYYYFHESDANETIQSYLYYPHFKNALSIYKQADVQLVNEFYTVVKPSERDYFFSFSKLTTHAAKTEIHPPFRKIGIVFQPLGLNHFINQNLAEMVQGPIHLNFNYFEPSMTYVLDQIYRSQTIDEKVDLLDAYFLSNLKGFNDPKMERAIALLMAGEARYTVESLAQKLEVSRKTLLRSFRKHQNCTVNDYIRLLRFRNAIETFKGSADQTTLTKLAHHTQYYDQSDFTNQFKKLTGFNPKSFFKKLLNLGNQDTYWTFD